MMGIDPAWYIHRLPNPMNLEVLSIPNVNGVAAGMKRCYWNPTLQRQWQDPADGKIKSSLCTTKLKQLIFCSISMNPIL
jgi:hypothetical protein